MEGPPIPPNRFGQHELGMDQQLRHAALEPVQQSREVPSGTGASRQYLWCAGQFGGLARVT